MRWNYRFLFAVAPLALLAACTPQDASYAEAEATAQDVMKIDRTAVAQSLDALEAAYIAAYNGGDAAGIAALFAADGRLSPPLTPALDVAGIEEAYAASFVPGVSMTLEVMREDFIASGGMVVAWGTYTVTAPSPEGEPIVSSGRYGSVSRQDPDGSLKIFRHMYNYEVPPPGFGEM
jgi:ketosteroid isomerase-like protein